MFFKILLKRNFDYKRVFFKSPDSLIITFILRKATNSSPVEPFIHNGHKRLDPVREYSLTGLTFIMSVILWT